MQHFLFIFLLPCNTRASYALHTCIAFRLMALPLPHVAAPCNLLTTSHVYHNSCSVYTLHVLHIVV